MSTTIVGLVQGIVKGKPYTANQGPQAGKQLNTHTITVDTDEGSVKVQKNTLTTTDFSIAAGTKVQVTFDTVQQGNFTNNRIAKDGLLILQDDGTPTQVTSTGQPKPAYVAGQTTSVVKSVTTSPVASQGLPYQNKSSYSSEGARNGMIVNASLALATARSVNSGNPGELTLTALKLAADDIKELTLYVETPQGTKASPKAQIEAKKEPLKKATQSKQVQAVIDDFADEDDDSSPFDQD